MLAAMVTSHLRRAGQGAALLLAAVMLAGCGSLLPQGTPGAVAPVETATSVPSAKVGVAVEPEAVVQAPPKAIVPRGPGDAVPRVERITPGHPNRPYEIRGEQYEPENTDVEMREFGVASWYGIPFHGRLAASGERYDMNAMTAAHPTMPLPSYARVRNLANGREVVVRVNDRGPFRGGRIIDLSRAAARKLGIAGIGMVEVVRLTNDEIRTGGWRERAPTSLASKAPAARTKAGAQRAAPTQVIAAK
jgi:rare lipoprotein A